MTRVDYTKAAPGSVTHYARLPQAVAEGLGVLAGVLIRGAVAAQRDTRSCQVRLDPSCANLRALLALSRLRVLDGLDGGRSMRSRRTTRPARDGQTKPRSILHRLPMPRV